MLARSWGIGLIIACCGTLSASALAQPDEDKDKKAAEEDAPVESDETTDETPSDTVSDEEAAAAVADDDDAPADVDEDVDDKPVTTDMDPKEEAGTRYLFLGLRFRDFIVPKFMIEIFADGGATTNVFSFGPEFTMRSDGLELNINLSYADYSMDPVLFKSKDDEITAYERVSSDMKMISGTIDILFEVWTADSSMFAFLIGGGVGIGGVFGDLKRNQVYPRNANDVDVDDPNKFTDCVAVGDPMLVEPSTGNQWCDSENDHYGDYDEPSWANGGSKPFIFPYIGLPQLSFRYKPIKQFQARADVGFAFTAGFFFGLNAAYGF